jgi:hypothetical protein
VDKLAIASSKLLHKSEDASVSSTGYTVRQPKLLGVAMRDYQLEGYMNGLLCLLKCMVSKFVRFTTGIPVILYQGCLNAGEVLWPDLNKKVGFLILDQREYGQLL